MTTDLPKAPASSPPESQEELLPARLNTFGFFSHPGTLEQYLALITKHIDKRDPLSVFYHNQHTIYSYFTNKRLKRCYQRATVIADGMCVVLLCKLSGFACTRDHRLTYVDFIMPLMQTAKEKQWRVFHVGQQSEVLDKALETLRTNVPGLQIQGHHGYFDQDPDSAESIKVIDQINSDATDLLLVGFGTPQQEYWIDAHRNRIAAPVVMSCGACMEYVGGAVRTPPRWMGRIGLEWSFRLLENPKRFAHRYTIQTVKLGFILIGNWLRQRTTDSNP